MKCVLTILLIVHTYGLVLGQEDPRRDSVVRLHVTANTLNLRDPWANGQQTERKGTGFVIDGQRVITNAHVVGFAQEILLESDRLPRRIPAAVEFIAMEMDLAVLRVDEPGFFDLIPAVEFVDALPADQDEVTVLGYPIGGEVLSATSGVVSRIESARYSRRSWGLRVQVDAAVNPGNSGGPAFTDDGCIGVVFSRARQGENIGYVIPTIEVRRFLQDIEDGAYDGKFVLDGQYVTTDNPGRRKKLGLSLLDTGLTVLGAPEGTGLKRWDVITEVAGQPIDDQGFGELYGRKLHMRVLVDDAVDESGMVEMEVIRDGERASIRVHLVEPMAPLFPEEDGPIAYFVHGPFAFAAASVGYANLVFNDRFAPALLSRQNPLATRRFERTAFPGEQIVILSRAPFSHPILRGHSDLSALMALKSVNGTQVRDLVHAYSLINESKAEFIELEFIDRGIDRVVTLDRRELAESTDDILDQHSIRNPVSDLVLEQLETSNP